MHDVPLQQGYGEEKGDGFCCFLQSQQIALRCGKAQRPSSLLGRERRGGHNSGKISSFRGASRQLPQPNYSQNCNPRESLKLKLPKVFVRFFIPKCFDPCPGNFAVGKQDPQHRRLPHTIKPGGTEHPPPKTLQCLPLNKRSMTAGRFSLPAHSTHPAEKRKMQQNSQSLPRRI